MTHTGDWIHPEAPREMRPGVVSLIAFDGTHVTVGVTRLTPGHEISLHSHPNEQIACILEGSVEFHIGDEVVRVDAGQMVEIPPNVPHYGQAVGDKPALNLDVWYPHRVPGA